MRTKTNEFMRDKNIKLLFNYGLNIIIMFMILINFFAINIFTLSGITYGSLGLIVLSLIISIYLYCVSRFYCKEKVTKIISLSMSGLYLLLFVSMVFTYGKYVGFTAAL